MTEASHKEIKRFDGEYSFLSNFFPCQIEYGGVLYQTSEHAYQSTKTLVPEERQLIIESSSPGKAKRLGRRKEDGGIVTLRPDWYDVRLGTMRVILEAKFAIPELEEKLLSTGNLRIIEGNSWGDVYWGVDSVTGIGKNMLGQLLMQIREDKQVFG
jgi:ribA/ribD-fused uncharacterized protein